MAGDIDGALVAVIADEDTITGFLLAGVGDVDVRRRSNFLVVDSKTTVRAVEAAFKDFTNREDVAIVLVSQPIANMIRHVVSTYSKVRARCVSVWVWVYGCVGALALPAPACVTCECLAMHVDGCLSSS
jgi:ATP synthase F subunit